MSDTIRISLHLVGVSIWLGGQVVMGGLVGTLKAMNPDAPSQAAKAFARVAWPAFGLTVITGMWGIMMMDPGQAQARFGIKMIMVVISGAAAYIHSASPSKAVKGISGGLGLLATVAALVLGVAL